jgi:signal peptidase II
VNKQFVLVASQLWPLSQGNSNLLKWPSSRFIIWFVSISGVTIVLDLLTKNWMLDLIFSPPRQIVLTSFLNLTPVWNSGISFGLFQNQQLVGKLIIPILALLVVLWLFFTLHELTSLQRFAASLIAGGAMGNVIDRLRFERVVDFLDVHIANYHWPAFNLADSAIFVGVVLWLYAAIITAQSGGRYNE